MDENECPCRGENPRCFRCDGTGLMSKSPKVAEASRSQASANERIVRAQSTSLPKKSTKRSKSKSGQKQKITARQIGISATTGSLSPCPLCGKPLQVGKLKKHIARSHADRYRKTSFGYVIFTPQGENPNSAQSSTGDRDQATLQQCPKCKATVKNLAKHMMKAHSLPEERMAKIDAPSGQIHLSTKIHRSPRRRNDSVLGTSSPQSMAGHHDAGQDLDASRGWGGSFRDHGQFGSYPAFDAMDDESMT